MQLSDAASANAELLYTSILALQHLSAVDLLPVIVGLLAFTPELMSLNHIDSVINIVTGSRLKRLSSHPLWCLDKGSGKFFDNSTYN